MVERNIYLDKVPLEEAREIILEKFKQNCLAETTEVIPVEEAQGRVNAEAVLAQNSAPHYYASAMDGIAVDVEATFGASNRSPKELILGEEAFLVDTGDSIPENCNGVIMIEDVNQIDEATVEITKSAVPGQHIRTIGENIMASELILPANSKLGPAEIGALLAAGVTEIKVKKKPRVAILPTGTELIEPGEDLAPGKIVEYNSRVIAGQVRKWGGNPTRIETVEDDLEAIKERVEQLSQEYDLVLIIAGSSAGEEDYTAQVIEDLGELLFHGVAIKPGKPLMAGVVNEKLAIGVPGYPVAAYLDTLLFVKPIIETYLGLSVSEPEKIEAELSQDLVSKLGQEEFVRVKLVEVAEKLRAVPLKRGAGVINSIMKADGLIRVSALSQGLNRQEKVDVELLTRTNYKQNLLAVGEQDQISEILTNQLRLSGEQLNFHIKNLDNETALEALERKTANLALLKSIAGKDSDKGLTLIKEKYSEVVVISLGALSLGLVVKAGNPKEIQGIQDLSGQDLSFVNRQPGMVARKLLDDKLQELGGDDKLITGYQREESTELGVANLVKEEIVDVGIASQGVAKVFNLDFIPLAKANCNLVISEFEFETEKVQLLLKVIKSQEFEGELKKIPGYDVRELGSVVYRK